MSQLSTIPYIADDKNGLTPRLGQIGISGGTLWICLAVPYMADISPYITDKVPYIADDKPYIADMGVSQGLDSKKEKGRFWL